jgi:Ca2+-binding RTX toxin-like protein
MLPTVGKDKFKPNYDDKTYFDQNNNLKPGTYTRDNIDEIFFQNDPLFDYSANLELRNYNKIDDYGETVYVWNSQQFSLPENVLYVVYSDGTKEIQNFRIEPNKRPKLVDKENFDFETANLGVGILSGLILEPRVDPSGIGRTVYFEFDDRPNIPFSVYNQTNFNSDVIKENSLKGFNPLVLNSAMLDEASKLFDSGITKFLYKDKPVIYGTENQDIFVPAEINKLTYPYQSEYKNNGYVFIGGEDIDYLPGGFNDDILIGNEGNDVITGDALSIIGIGGEDTLDGGEGNDSLNGSVGDDVAIFSDKFENYAYSISEDKKTITVAHVISPQTDDGVDTLKDIEWATFKDTTQPLGNARLASASPTAPRIIPLPLEDGILDTEAVKAIDTTPSPSPNDPPTPPHVSLAAPVAMLDGNVDYTLNISPYKPDTQYNILYIFDTSLSIDAVELQQAKDAYTNLTNYFVNHGLAENINFGLVSYDNQATLETDSSGSRNLTADEAIAAIQGLTTATTIGTDYDAGLWQGVNFLTTSPLRPSFPTNPDGTTSISYFFSDGQSSSDRFTMLNTAKTLRRYSHVQAFGVTNPSPTVAADINFIDSNNGVIMSNIANLSTELSKSGLAGKVNHVNILVDGVVVDTIQPSELTDSPLGLTYEGSVDNLDVSVNGKNVITAEAVFNNNTATTSANFTVTAGEGKLTDSSGNPLVEPVVGNDEDPFKRMRNGGDGNDDITLGYVDQGASGGIGNDYIVGNKRDNQLDGGVGNDTILAHEGNDTIITGAGTNKVDGGDGIDTAVYSDVVYQGNTSIFLRQAADTVSYNNTDTLTDVEYLQFSDVRLDAKTRQVVPILEAAEVNIAEGDSGTKNAQVTFNLSTPAPVVDTTTDTITENQGEGTDTVASSFTYTLGASPNLENITLTGISAINATGNPTNNVLEGNSANNSLSGTAGNDTLTGGAGIDTLIGGAGNDLYTVDTATDTITENANEGTDTVNSDVNHSLGANVENLSLIASGAIEGYGNILNNSITGNATNNKLIGNTGNDTVKGGLGDDLITGGYGSDLLIGEGGNDTLAGGVANDTYVVDSIGDSVSETSTLATEIDTVQSSISYSLGTNVENLTLIGAGEINATGNSLGNVITGNTANNQLDGGAGVDTLIGGTGNDIYVVDTTTDIITESANQGIDTVATTVAYSLGATSNLENITLTGTSAINATGNTTNNTLEGNSANNNLSGDAGNDTLAGGAGIDTLIGGLGNDFYTIDTATDTITENANEGTDIVSTSVNYSLGANVENLSLIGSTAVEGYGNTLNNSITGNTANNKLIGNTGNDTVTGGLGDDLITGGYGSDSFMGDEGNDTLAGGAAGDRFIYDTNAVFTASAVGIDRITDFVSGTDKIVLDKTTFTALGSVVGGGFNLANEFAVVGSDASAATADALIAYSSGTGNLFYNQDGVTAGFGSGAQLATLTGIPAIAASDFVLQA